MLEEAEAAPLEVENLEGAQRRQKTVRQRRRETGCLDKGGRRRVVRQRRQGTGAWEEAEASEPGGVSVTGEVEGTEPLATDD